MGTAMAEFALAATLLILAPGPDSMLVLRNALRGGRRVGLSTAAGTVTGLMSWAVAAALGISALLAASRVGYDTLRFAGGAYLIALGIVTLRRRGSVSGNGQKDVVPRDGAAPGTFRGAPAQEAGLAKGGMAADHDWATVGRDGDGRDDQKGEDKVAQNTAAAGKPAGRRPAPSLRRAYLNGLVSNACNPKIGVFFIAFLPNLMPPGVSTRAFSLVLGTWFAVETGLWLAALVWMAEHAKAWVNRPRLQRRLEQLTGVVLIGFGVRLATESRT